MWGGSVIEVHVVTRLSSPRLSEVIILQLRTVVGWGGVVLMVGGFLTEDTQNPINEFRGLIGSPLFYFVRLSFRLDIDSNTFPSPKER